MKTCDAMRDLIIAYSLEGLDGSDTRQLLEHVVSCQECYEYLRSTGTVLQLLPYSLPPTTPPPGLRSRVMDAIRQDQSETDVAPLSSGRWRTVASLAAAAVLGIGMVVALWQNFSLQHEVRETRAALADTTHQLHAAATVLGEDDIEPVQVLYMEKEDEHRFAEAWGHATLYNTRYGDVMVMALGGIPEPEGDGVYRIWLVDGEEWHETGTVYPDAEGFATFVLRRDELAFERAVVTLDGLTQDAVVSVRLQP